MDHTEALAADFAADHDFIQWVKYPTSESNIYWKNFMMAHPEKEETIAEARQLVQLLSQEDADEEAYDRDMQLVWQKLAEARHSDTGLQPETGKVISLRSFWQERTWLSVAAIGLLLIMSGIVYWKLQPEQRIEYATQFGEKRTIQLPDNSVIVLNSNSVVTIPEKWPINEPRQVYLKGEAFFSVTHQANNQKFVVTTSAGTQIDVLGTEFNVYDWGHENRVVLASGKVSLQVVQGDKSSRLDMKPGEMVSVTTDAGITRKQVKPALYISWKEDKVYFDDYTLAEVATMLEQNYGYQVVFRDKTLQGQRITAFLDAKGLDDILSTIAETFEVEVSRQNDKIIINSLQ
ncbi:FecR domain-containing protein [Pontibacter sp. JH31]|uniref:FecR domain-containing protein n=1 Tax=Pontibacter aquaedesilientis TaxID=2766980 RepID=A0ABR7XDK3_9BACT|nr:FecR domain-containing protein [Pontibacter aquaedesilientis]MBD1395683.1 FecR domain-containing protein [Pontibacter aquaedesilientis]